MRSDVTRQATDRHLRVLRDVGLVTSTRHGREVRHTVNHAPLHDTARWPAVVKATAEAADADA